MPSENSQEKDLQIIAAITKCLKERGGRSSVSCLMQDLRFDGWRRLGLQHVDFEPMLERLGFKLEYRMKGGCVTGTFVSMEGYHA